MPLFGGWSSSGADQTGAEQPERRTTRSQTANLQLPSSATIPGVGRARSRTPSPRPIGHNENSAVIFTNDSTNLSQRVQQQQQQPDLHNSDFEDEEVFQEASAAAPQSSMTSTQTPEEMRSSVAAAVDAANSATAALQAATSFISGMQQQQEQLQQLIALQQQQLQQQQQASQGRIRKPELPDFDAKNVDVWLKRVNAAYERAGISLAKDKFAFLETKFRVGANPKIDEYLYGPATDSSWSDFVSYIRHEYGRTVRQEAQFLRGQHSRDGRRPTQMLAHILDKVKRVTIDDIVKDIVISALPSDVQRMLAEKITDMTAAQTAAMADHYFDQDGRPLHSPSNAAVSHIPPIPPQSALQEEVTDEAEINAVKQKGNFRPRGGASSNPRSTRPFNNASGPPNRTGVKNRSSFFGASGGASSNTSSTSFNGASAAAAPNPAKKSALCRNHDKFGDNAYSCHPSCPRWPEMQRKGNGQAGNRM